MISEADNDVLTRAAQYAVEEMPILELEWLNNCTILFISQRLREILTANAVAQNEVVFRAPGLTLLAAPWEYTKLNRLAVGSIDIALTICRFLLRRYLTENGLNTVPRRTIEQWADEDSALRHLISYVRLHYDPFLVRSV
jgi:hypothetical protein